MSKDRLGTMSPDFYWQLGKTAASIRFVHEAESVLERRIDADNSIRLRQFVACVKSGKIVLESWITVADFFAHQLDKESKHA